MSIFRALSSKVISSITYWIAQRPILKYGLFLLGSGLLIWMMVKEAMQFGDFRCYLEAAQLIETGQDPYADWIQIQGDNWCQYFYSPLWAILLIPFSALPQFIPNLLWLTISLFCMVRSWQILLSWLPTGALNREEVTWVVIISLAMSARFLQLDFALIQMTSFMLWGSLESVRWAREGRAVRAAALLALIINIKILPVVFVPYLIYRNHWKAALWTGFFLSVYITLPAFILGWERHLALLASWWQQIDPMSQHFLAETELGPHSLTALIPTLLTSVDGTLELKRNIMNVPLETSTAILNAVRVGLVVLTLRFVDWPPFKRPSSVYHELREIGYIALLIPLIFPHQQKYAFSFILPAAFYLSVFMVSFYRSKAFRLSRGKVKLIITLAALAFCLMTLSTDGIIGRELNEITQHYKTITWGAMLLIAALFLASPNALMQPAMIQEREEDKV